MIADSDQTILVEGNHYFPPDSVRRDVLRQTDTQTICPWKGTAGYYDVAIDGQVNGDAAWYYEDPLPAAAGIKNYVAFWRGVVVEPV